MALLSNVSITNTFLEWLTRTNQLVVKTNNLELSNITNVVSNTATISVSGELRLGNTIYISSNAFPNTGGTINGDTNINGNLTIFGVTVSNGVIDLL